MADALTFKQAQAQARKVGAAHATGDGYRANNASVIASACALQPASVYAMLCATTTDDPSILAMTVRLMKGDLDPYWAWLSR